MCYGGMEIIMINKNKFAGIGLVFGLMIGASISSIGAGAGSVIGLIIGGAIDYVLKWRKPKN
jgi:urea transporter